MFPPLSNSNRFFYLFIPLGDKCKVFFSVFTSLNHSMLNTIYTSYQSKKYIISYPVEIIVNSLKNGNFPEFRFLTMTHQTLVSAL